MKKSKEQPAVVANAFPFNNSGDITDLLLKG